jgi:hypothetical protein
MKTLEQILEERDLFGLDELGNRCISDKCAAEEAYFEYAEDTGFVNRWINNLYKKRLKGKAKLGPVGSFLKAYIGGAMTRGDQEAFALIAEKEAHVLTKQNALIEITFSPQYYVMVQGTGWAGSFVTEEFPDAVDEVAYGLTGFIIAANLVRLGLATKKRKAYASISIESVIMNGPTYMKRLKQKIFG